LTNFYETHDLAGTAKVTVEELLKKYKKKRGSLLFKLAKGYGVEKSFVRFDNIKAEL
jgi:hypothetical protein